MKEETKYIIGILVVCIFVAGLITLAMVGLPKYRIYKQDLRGQAELREAEWTKKILVEEAIAQKEASVLEAEKLEILAQAEANREVIRAKGVAEANKIIGESLRDNEEYLRYLWIQGLQDGSSEVIYIPTEANLPILEAGAR